MEVSDVAKMRALEDKNRLKKLLADSALEIDALKIDRIGKPLTPAQRRRAARAVITDRAEPTQGLCRRNLQSQKTFRRVLRLTDDAALLQRLQELAAERRRFGYR
jgi:hypothetical protein